MNSFKYSLPGVAALMSLGILVACSGQNGSRAGEPGVGNGRGQDVTGQAVLAFDTLTHDFGTILEGEKVVCYFEYRNNGKTDLILTSVTATCGCTTPDWNSEPLAAGGKETLKVIFDSSGRSGIQHKSVDVRSNAGDQVTRLTITADIVDNH